MSRPTLKQAFAMVCGAVAVCAACMFGAGVLLRDVNVVTLSTIAMMAGLTGVTLFKVDS